MLAALVNGTAGVSLEMDEGNRWGGGHPAIHVLPATLAIAEELGGRRPAVDRGARRWVRSHLPARRCLAGAAQCPFPRNVGDGRRRRGRGQASQSRCVRHPHRHQPRHVDESGELVAALLRGRDHSEPLFRALEHAGHPCHAPARLWLHGGCTMRRPTSTVPASRQSASIPKRSWKGVSEDRVARLPRLQRNYFKFHACCLYNHAVLDAVQSLVRAEGFWAPRHSATSTSPR